MSPMNTHYCTRPVLRLDLASTSTCCALALIIAVDTGTIIPTVWCGPNGRYRTCTAIYFLGFIPKYLTFSKFGQIYQYTSCLLSKFRFHTNIPHFGGPVYQYTSCFLKIPAIYQYTACMIWARKKGRPIYLMFSKNGQIYQYTSI